ncbi:MAG TPA: hypothetical protein VFW71_13720 [Actinomycetota bacterium]|nr:hypothetical protein [Actinomycetota bacterium]
MTVYSGGVSGSGAAGSSGGSGARFRLAGGPAVLSYSVTMTGSAVVTFSVAPLGNRKPAMCTGSGAQGTFDRSHVVAVVDKTSTGQVTLQAAPGRYELCWWDQTIAGTGSLAYATVVQEQQ